MNKKALIIVALGLGVIALTKIASIQEAVKVSRDQLKEYKEGANEWRNENLDQRRLFVTEEKFNMAIKAIAVTGVISVLTLAGLLISLFTYLR